MFKILNRVKFPFEKPIFWFFFLSIFLSLVWSRGFLLDFAEEGLHFYNPLRTLRLFSNLWLEIYTGISTPFMFPRITLYGFAGALQIIGLPSWLTQVTINTLLISNALYWMFKLASILFPDKRPRVYYFTSLFYLFNLFTMSQIWVRFIYTFIFLWSFLPLFLFLFIKWLKSGRIKYLFWLCISSFIFSDAFGTPSSVAVLWGPALLYFLFFAINNRRKKILFITIVRLFIVLICWIVTNLWWIYPLYRLSSGNISPFVTPTGNFSSLKAVSASFPSSQIFLLRQKYFFGETWPWHSFYSHPIIYLVSICVFLVMLYGIIKNKKEKNWLFLVLFLLIGWFISKGSNPPFGSQFYYFIFTKFPFLTIFRNPYEKGGLVFVLPYAVFFGLGIDAVYRAIKKKKDIIIFSSVFVIFVLLVWPMWTGNLFIPSVRVVVPNYYTEMNNFLKNERSSRLLQLPYNKSVGVTYNWGFVGLDASHFLFDSPSISAVSGFDIFDNNYNRFPQFFPNPNFSNILKVMGISNVILRKDIKYGPYYMIDDLAETQKFIEKWKGVVFQKEIGGLDIYSVENPLNMIWSPKDILKVNSYDEMFSRMIDPRFDVRKDAFVVNNQINSNSEIPKDLAPPQVKIQKVSASFYKVQVINAKSPFVLMLNQTYDSLWEARVGAYVFPKHFVVNGYANGWVVDKEGDYEIDLVFKIWPWE